VESPRLRSLTASISRLVGRRASTMVTATDVLGCHEVKALVAEGPSKPPGQSTSGTPSASGAHVYTNGGPSVHDHGHAAVKNPRIVMNTLASSVLALIHLPFATSRLMGSKVAPSPRISASSCRTLPTVVVSTCSAS